MFFISSSVQLFTCKMPPVLWVKRSVVPQGRRSSFHEFVGRFWSDWFHPGNPCRTERNFRLFVDPSVQKVLKQRNVIRFPLESTKGLRAYILRLRELSNFWPPLPPCSIIRSQYLKLSSKENEGSLKGWFHSPDESLLVLRNTTNPKKCTLHTFWFLALSDEVETKIATFPWDGPSSVVLATIFGKCP